MAVSEAHRARDAPTPLGFSITDPALVRIVLANPPESTGGDAAFGSGRMGAVMRESRDAASFDPLR